MFSPVWWTPGSRFMVTLWLMVSLASFLLVKQLRPPQQQQEVVEDGPPAATCLTSLPQQRDQQQDQTTTQRHVGQESGNLVENEVEGSNDAFKANNALSAANVAMAKVGAIKDSVLSLDIKSKIPEKSVPDKIIVMKQLHSYLQDLSLLLPSIELTALPSLGNGNDAVVISLEDAVREATERLADVTNFMETMTGQTNTPHDHESSSTDNHNSITQPRRDHRRVKEEKGNGPWGGRRTTFKDADQSRLNEPGSKQRRRFHHRFQTHPKYEHLHKIQEAVMNGDHGYVNNFLSSMHRSTHYGFQHAPGSSGGGHGRRMNFESSDNFKLDQCKLLASCASRMSLYDLLVFFLSDDIDSATGEVDTSILLFDEINIAAVYNSMRNNARGLDTAFETNSNLTLNDTITVDTDTSVVEFFCITLLERFHRTVEFDGLPQWEGATVSQVCLAEGTTVYVKLEELATKVVPVFGEANRVLQLGVAGTVLQGVLGCANKLLNSNDRLFSDDERHSNETNIIQGSAGALIPIDVDRTGSARDEHGQIRSNTNSGLLVKSVDIMLSEARAELNASIAEQAAKCMEDPNAAGCDDLDATVNDLIIKARGDLCKEYDKGLELLFGSKPSVGFICGIADAVADRGATLPGTCCLDAPYDLADEQWGLEYQCEIENVTSGEFVPNQCFTIAPYFAKIRKESCDVYGGTFCPNTNCTRLQQCVAEFIVCAEDEELPAFVKYLQSSPDITDPTDAMQCGRAREYFGFPPSFINDNQVCEDVEQLRNSPDFEFLEEFYNQGSEIENPGNGDGNNTRIPVPPLVLEPPDPENDEATDALSKSPPVQNGLAWRSQNHALKLANQNVDVIYNTIADTACTFGSFAIAQDACNLARNIALAVTRVTVIITQNALDVSEFQYGEAAELDNIKPIETGERIKKIYDNMVLTGDYLQERFQGVNNYLRGMENRLLRPLSPSLSLSPQMRSIAALVQTATDEESPVDFEVWHGVGCDGLDQDGILGIDNCEEDLYAPSLILSSFASSVQVAVCDVDYCFNEYFGNETDATTFLGAFFQVFDDCAPAENLRMDISKITDSSCGETQFKITPVQTFPEDSSCSQTVLRGLPLTVKLGLDETPPVVSCGFLAAHDCPVSDDGKSIVIPENQATMFVDAPLFYNVEESCPGEVDVTVSVSSNEFVHGSEIAVLTNVERVGGPTQARLFVTPQSCANGSQGNAMICETDPSVEFRFYEVKVSALDGAGNTAVDTCFVIIDGEESEHEETSIPPTNTQGSSQGSSHSYSQKSSMKMKMKGMGMMKGKSSKRKGTRELSVSINDLLEDISSSTVRYILATVASVRSFNVRDSPYV